MYLEQVSYPKRTKAQYHRCKDMGVPGTERSGPTLLRPARSASAPNHAGRQKSVTGGHSVLPEHRGQIRHLRHRIAGCGNISRSQSSHSFRRRCGCFRLRSVPRARPRVAARRPRPRELTRASAVPCNGNSKNMARAAPRLRRSRKLPVHSDVRDVACSLDGDSLGEIVFAAIADMRLVSGGSAHHSEELVVAALQRTATGQISEMPFADKRGAKTGAAQQ